MVERKDVEAALQARRRVDPRIALGSIGLGIGATAVANGMGGIAVAIVAWIAIVIVNLVYALRR